MSDFVVVASFQNVHDASGAIGLLSSEDIYSQLKDELNNPFIKPFDRVGSDVKLLVRKEDAARAISILIQENIISEKDLGPDPSVAWLTKKLNQPWVQKVFSLFESFFFWLIAIAIIVGLLIIIRS